MIAKSGVLFPAHNFVLSNVSPSMHDTLSFREVEHRQYERSGKVRTTMSQDRLNSHSIMIMESDITKQLDYSDVVDEFVDAKRSRKRYFQK